MCQIAKNFGALPQIPLGAFRVGPQTPLFQSSEIPNLCLTAQNGNFWLTPCKSTEINTAQKWQWLPLLITKVWGPNWTFFQSVLSKPVENKNFN